MIRIDLLNNNINEEVVPSTSGQTYTKTFTFEVPAVDASIDANIQPENIKKNVQILGVTGTLEAGSGKPEQTKEVEYTENGTYEVTPDEGYTLESVEVTVDVAGSGSDLREWGVDSSTEEQVLVPHFSEILDLYPENGADTLSFGIGSMAQPDTESGSGFEFHFAPKDSGKQYIFGGIDRLIQGGETIQDYEYSLSYENGAFTFKGYGVTCVFDSSVYGEADYYFNLDSSTDSEGNPEFTVLLGAEENPEEIHFSSDIDPYNVPSAINFFGLLTHETNLDEPDPQQMETRDFSGFCSEECSIWRFSGYVHSEAEGVDSYDIDAWPAYDEEAGQYMMRDEVMGAVMYQDMLNTTGTITAHEESINFDGFSQVTIAGLDLSSQYERLAAL